MSANESLPLFHDTTAGQGQENMVPNTRKAQIECISDDALIHLKSYKYSSVDKSPVSKYILGPWWNFFVTLLPLWMAPNMVTLVGFFFILANVALLVVYIPDLIGPTMDNVDGKQARRTGTSSGLGELFDHGIDSLNCTLASLFQVAAMGLGTSPAGVFTALCPCVAMFFSTWETYHTHTLFLGYINGPTEGLLIACGIMIASGIWGPEIWSQPMAGIFSDILPGLADMLGETSVRDIWVPLVGMSLLGTHVPFCVFNVIGARRKQGLPIAPVFLELAPMTVFSVTIVAWLGSPYSTLMKENHLILFCCTMSFVFGRLTTKMILAHLTRQPFPYWTAMLWPLVGGAVLANLPRIGFPQLSATLEAYYLWAYFVFATVLYFRWAFIVVNAICNFLGINALTIPKDKQIANKRAHDAAKLH
ncbi:putative CDP-alcohol phosphatidyltransferase class-I family protein [Beauveria bassiana]|nr:putative CDP-alcohol phosphatidyltransferase class-I family protein [Beauveria bassiana]